MPVFRRKPAHWDCLVESPEKAGVRATGTLAGNGVLRRSKVARIARTSSGPSNGKSRASWGDVVEVLHATVGHAELNHRFELLGDHGLARVRTQTRRGKLQQRRELDDVRVGRDRVAEADIDLDSHARRGDSGTSLDAHPTVFLGISDCLDTE